jgi:hypothetical protein
MWLSVYGFEMQKGRKRYASSPFTGFGCWLVVIPGPDPQRRLGSIHTAKLT